MPHLSDADREAIAHMTMRLQNQFLHHPRAAVRSAVAEPHHDHPHPILDAVRHLFGLGDRAAEFAQEDLRERMSGAGMDLDGVHALRRHTGHPDRREPTAPGPDQDAGEDRISAERPVTPGARDGR